MRRRFVFSLAELTYAIALLCACTAAGVRIGAEPEPAQTVVFSNHAYALEIMESDLLGPDTILPP